MVDASGKEIKLVSRAAESLANQKIEREKLLKKLEEEEQAGGAQAVYFDERLSDKSSARKK
jgi:hypothetical protein